MSYNVKFEAEIEAKSFALSVEEAMTSDPFIIMGTAVLPLFIIWLVLFRNSRDPLFLLFNQSLDSLLLSALGVSQNPLTADESERSKVQTTPLFAIQVARGRTYT